jgi:uncharacterized phage-associated protein
MAYPAKAVANYFINKANKEGDINFTPMKLLKLLYIAHGWNLAIFDKPLIDEPIEAWSYGPVVPAVYHAVKHFGLKVINEPIEDMNVNSNGQLKLDNYHVNFDKETEALLDKIITTYKQKTGIELSNWSHNKDGPWCTTWNGGRGINQVISNEQLKDYFQKLGNGNAK